MVENPVAVEVRYLQNTARGFKVSEQLAARMSARTSLYVLAILRFGAACAAPPTEIYKWKVFGSQHAVILARREDSLSL